MKYHYEKKFVITNKLQFWIWAFIVVISIANIGNRLYIGDLFAPHWWLPVIQFICGIVIMMFTCEYKRTRVYDEEDVTKSADYAADASNITAEDLKKELLS